MGRNRSECGGCVCIPHCVNARGLKVAKVEILAPFIEIVPPSHSFSGPPPGGDVARVCFHVCEDMSHACIPIAYSDLLDDVEPVPPFRVAMGSCPIFGYGMLRVKFEGSNDIHFFRCALFAAGWDAWCLSRQNILEHMYSDGSEQPHFTSSHLVVRDALVPLVGPYTSVWASIELSEL